MSFFWIYIVFPLFLFGVNHRGRNWILVAYWLFVSVFSYDNFSDYSVYNAIFLDEGRGFSQDKVIEPGWRVLQNLFQFSKYGMVLCQALVMLLVCRVYYMYSKKLGLVSYSILLYFLFNMPFIFDQVKREDIAICLGIPVFFMVINDKLGGAKLLKS